ncbi:hypothetical protein U1Q18_017436 [Sarracenia purpurea var. burkii]
MILQLCIVLVPIHNPSINPVLTAAGTRDAAHELKNFGPVAQLVHEPHEGAPSPLLIISVVEGIDQILQLGAPELPGSNAQNEADGVLEVELGCAIRADDDCEVEEGANGLGALIGLEVLEFKSEDFPRRGKRRHGFWFENPTP